MCDVPSDLHQTKRDRNKVQTVRIERETFKVMFLRLFYVVDMID